MFLIYLGLTFSGIAWCPGNAWKQRRRWNTSKKFTSYYAGLLFARLLVPFFLSRDRVILDLTVFLVAREIVVCRLGFRNINDVHNMNYEGR